MAPVGLATVVKGQRSRRVMMSVWVRLRARSREMRDWIGGTKMLAQWAWAAEAMLLSGPSSKDVQRSWFRVLFWPASSEMERMG